MMVPASSNGVALRSLSQPQSSPFCTHTTPNITTYNTLNIRPRPTAPRRPAQQAIAYRSTRYRPTDCGSCCPCAHHQPLMLGLVADPSLSAFRFVEHASQKYIRSAKRTLRRRRWPATFAPMVFIHCRCEPIHARWHHQHAQRQTCGTLKTCREGRLDAPLFSIFAGLQSLTFNRVSTRDPEISCALDSAPCHDQ